MLRSSLMALVCCFLVSTANLNAQEEASKASTSVSLNADGQLVGNAFATVNGEAQPVEAKITLAKDGVVIKSVYAKEDGSFAFPSVEPGVYNMYGSAANYVGGQTVNVGSHSTSWTPVNFGLNSVSGVSYGSYSAAPAATYSYGGGGFSGGFGGGGRGLLRGFRNSRLLKIGAITGIVVAVSSPSN